MIRTKNESNEIGVFPLNNVIDFFSFKKKKQEEQIAKLFQKANSFQNREQIDKLIDEKNLTVEDHKNFLAFLAYSKEKKIEPTELFTAVLKMSKHQFELRYEMNWHAAVQNCLTFLTILKERDQEQYEQFLKEQ